MDASLRLAAKLVLGTCLILPAGPMAAAVGARSEAGDWPGWRGPGRQSVAPAAAVLAGRNGIALQVVWRQKLGSGYSSVSVADGRAVTLFSDGESDYVAAYDVSDGRLLWRHRIAETYPGHDGSHTGPISTPLVAEGKVFALGPWGHLLAVDLETGNTVWSTHLTEEHEAEKPYYGFGTSPLLVDGVLVVQFTVKDESFVGGLDPQSGRLLWASGSDAASYQSPLILSVSGRRQILAVGDKFLYGVAPATGAILWEHAHGGDEYTTGGQSMNPVLAGASRILLTYKHEGSTLIELTEEDGAVVAKEVWANRTIRNTYSTPVYHDGHFYAFSSRFLTCIDAATGEAVWKSRAPGDGWLILVDGHLVIVTKRGVLHVAEATPEGYREVASLKLFKNLSWTPASFAAGRIFTRSMGEIAAVDLRQAAMVAEAAPAAETRAAPPTDTPFGRFLADVTAADDKAAVVDEFLASVDRFPLVEPPDRVHFLYRGEARDMAIAGDMLEFRHEEPMRRLEDTDLFYYTARLEPDAWVSYRFVKDFEENLTDPWNPRQVPSMFGEMSWVAMPRWKAPDYLQERQPEQEERLESLELESKLFEKKRRIDVYLPPGYDAGDRRYPVAYIHSGKRAREWGKMTASLDALMGERVQPLIAVFIHELEGEELIGDERDAYADMFAQELVPFIDGRYRTVQAPMARASIGTADAGYVAFYSALKHPGLVGKISSQSMFMLDVHQNRLQPLVQEALEQPLEIYMDWGKYDLRSTVEAWNMVETNRRWVDFLRRRGYEPAGGEIHGGFGWGSWRNRTDSVLEALFPLQSPAPERWEKGES